jgi:tetratricopeptide (TPR) repeat protein
MKPLRTRTLAPAARLVAAAALSVSAWMAPCAARANASSDELVRQARAHESAREDDVAARRYMEALEIDPTSEDAWLGLGALRLRLGEPGEAERVYEAGLARVPTMRRALEGRARARWARGRHPEAEADLETYAALEPSAASLRELAGWYGSDGRAPAQLATWRRLLAMAVQGDDAASEHEARRMVRALVILTEGVDPVTSPSSPDATRRAMARIARRGG